MNIFKDDVVKTKKIIPLIKRLLTIVGEDIGRDGLKETPKRVARAYQELLQGYNYDPKKVFKLFDSEGYQGIITIDNISFYSLCEHHMVPFYGKINIGYVPNGKILGLSKFGRLVDILSKRLQVQEKLTKQIADCIEKNLKPKGVIVMSQAEHMCMSMRGVQKSGCHTKVIVKRGLFNEQEKLVETFFHQVNRKY